MADLWELKSKKLNNGGVSLVPVLSRPGTDTNLNGSIYTNTIIDVIGNFQWTKNPTSARRGVPAITLTEKRILVNSNISNIANSTFALAGNDPLTKSAVVVAAAIFAGPIVGIYGATVAAIAAATGISTDSASFTLKQVENIIGRSSTFNNPTLQPYNYLYLTQPTGFIYSFPYLDNSYVDNSLTFGGAEQNLLGDATNIVGNIAAGAAGIGNAVKPGTYIEQSQQFAMADKGRTINIKFPLLNTGTVEDIQQNWQLLFGLIYQNRPGRETRSIIDLPVIYEVSLPGVVYMPYAYISSLSVKFLGSRRLLKIQAPISNGAISKNIPPFDTIIPDAYEVNITIQGLNDETKNFIYAAIAGNTSSSVTIGDAPLPINQTVAARNNSATETANAFNPSRLPIGGSSPGGVIIPTGGFNFPGP